MRRILANLRRLEELKAPETVPVATDLARGLAGLVRDNAVAALVRSKSPEAAAALAGLPPDARALAQSLGGGS